MGSSPSKVKDGVTTIDINQASSPATNATDENPKSGNAEAASFNEAEILSQVKKTMQDLSASQDFLSNDIYAHLNTLVKIFYQFSNTHKEILYKVCDVMIANNLLDVFVRMWDLFHQNTELYADIQSDQHSNLLRMKIIFWNYSDKCVNLSKAAYQQKEVIDRVMREFDIAELGIVHLKDHRKRHIIKANLGILHNFVRLYEKNKDLIRLNNGIEKILEYNKSTYLIVKAKVFIVLAYCINEDENDKIMTSTGVLAFIKDLLDSALSSPNHVAKSYAFSAYETTAALNKLAQNDKNKKSIVEAGVLPLLVKMLDTETCSEEELHTSVSCIWSLAFHPENRDPIIDEPGLIDLIKKIRSETKSEPRLRDACISVLFVLGLEKKPENVLSNDNQVKKHIMLSYNWDVQQTILQLRDFLTEQGHKVWMDVDKMQDSILAAMAEAVENSLVIVVAVTEAYKNSNSCRTEAEYSYKRNVPLLPLLLQEGYTADGWLGAMIGTKIYVDLTSGEIGIRFLEVQKQLLNQLKLTGDKRVVPVLRSDETPSAPSLSRVSKALALPKLTSVDGGVFSLVKAKLPCNAWGEEEVQEWYRSIDGAGKSNALTGCNGIILAQLCKMLVRSPESYYSLIKNELHLNFKDCLLLTNSIEDLMSK